VENEGFSYNLGGKTAKEHFHTLSPNQQMIWARAIDVAEVTIPSLVPPIGYITGGKLYTPYSSIGSRGVNTLAGKLMQVFLPPGQTIFRHVLTNDAKKQAVDQIDPNVWAKIEVALAARERAVRNRMDATPLRSVVFEALKLLIVAGNCLYQHTNLDEPVVHPVERYVTKRDRSGKPVLTILREVAYLATLDEDIQDLVMRARSEGRHFDNETTPKADDADWSEEVEIFTICKLVNKGRKEKQWQTWQEIEGYVVPGSDAFAPLDAPPLYPLWMIPVYGQDWGRSYADEYYGDLLTCDNFSKALNEAAAAASKTLFFVKPGARTRPKDITESDNLATLIGSAEDVSVLQLQGKGPDYTFVSNYLQEVYKRLSFAFLLNSAIQRNGERVTAEEISLMAEELEESMGGVYAILSQTFQQVLVNRFVFLMEREKELGPLPEGMFSLQIATGTDALGRTYDGKLLDEFMQRASAGGANSMKYINWSNYLSRVATSSGIDPTGLVIPDDQVAAQEQQAMQQQQQHDLMKAAAGPGIKAMSDAVQSGKVQLPQQPGQPAQPPSPTNTSEGASS